MLSPRKRMNRKGDVSITTIILIIIGLVVAVMLILGFTNFTDLLFGKASTIDPGKVETLAQACSGYASGELTIAYCQYRDMGVKVNGKELYANCAYPQIQEALKQKNGIVPNIACSQTSIDSFCQEFTGNKENLQLNNVAGACGTGATESCTSSAGTTLNDVACICGKSSASGTANKICNRDEYCKIIDSTGIGYCSDKKIEICTDNVVINTNACVCGSDFCASGKKCVSNSCK